MFEAASIGVSLILKDHFSATFGKMSRQAELTELRVSRLQKSLELFSRSAHYALGAGLGAMIPSGLFTLGKHFMEPAMHVGALQVSLRELGTTSQEQAMITSAAWKNAGDVMTTTVSQNIETIMHFRRIIGAVGPGGLKEAISLLKPFSQMVMAIQGAVPGMSGVRPDQYSVDMLKAVDMRLQLPKGTPIGARMQAVTGEARAMTAALILAGGSLSPASFQQTFKYARISSLTWDKEFTWAYLPYLMFMMQAGRGRGGGGMGIGGGPAVPLMALHRAFVQGIHTRPISAMMAQLGLSTGGSLSTTTTGTISAPIVGSDLLAKNPFMWYLSVFRPAILKNLLHTGALTSSANPPQQSSAIQSWMAHQPFTGTASQALIQMETKTSAMLMDKKLYDLVKVDRAIKDAGISPPVVSEELQAQWNNTLVALGTVVLPIVISGMMKLANTLKDLSQWFHKNGVAADLTMGAIASLSILLGVTGLASAAGFAIIGIRSLIGGLATLGVMGGAGGTLAAGAGAGALAPLALRGGVAGALGLLAAPEVAIPALAAAGLSLGLVKLYEHIRDLKTDNGKMMDFRHSQKHPLDSRNPSHDTHVHIENHIDGKKISESSFKFHAKRIVAQNSFPISSADVNRSLITSLGASDFVVG